MVRHRHDGDRPGRTRSANDVSEKRNDMLMLKDYTPPECFDPWVGSQYKGNGLWNRKVLVVGESHYDEWREKGKDQCWQRSTTKHKLLRTFTQECVQDVVNGNGGAPYWPAVRNRLGGEEYEKQSPDVFWNKVAFYNFIQSPVPGCPPKARPTQAQWEAAPALLKQTITRLRPDRILFTGKSTGPRKSLWNYVPCRNGKLPDIEVDGVSLPLEFFTLKDGKRVYVTATAHPRSNLFIRALTPALKEFVVGTWEHSAAAVSCPGVKIEPEGDSSKMASG